MTSLAYEEEQVAAAERVGEVVPYAAPAVEEYRPRLLMDPDEARAQDEALRAAMRAVLQENTDYGTIPGTNKPSLYKPGAEKLLQWFGFGHRMERVETERASDGSRIGVTYRCTVIKAMLDGREITVAECEGYAGYDEDRFYVTAEQAEAKERALAERYRRSPNPAKFAEYRAPWNSVIKMCEKRALVGAALQATSASTLFTQDVEDNAPAEAASATNAIAEAGRSVITGLSPEARSALDAWYKDKRWPDPSQWDVEQWCGALVEAGRLSSRHALAEAVAGALPDEELRQAAQGTAGKGHGDPAWEATVAKLSTFGTEKEANELWAAVIARRKAGLINAAEDKRLKGIITARARELKDAAAKEGTLVAPLDPADPWAARVEEIASEADAEALTEEVANADIDPGKAASVHAAIAARVESLQVAA